MTKEEHVKHLLEDPVYAIMGNEELCLGRSNMDVAKELIAAGVTIIQYRENIRNGAPSTKKPRPLPSSATTTT